MVMENVSAPMSAAAPVAGSDQSASLHCARVHAREMASASPQTTADAMSALPAMTVPVVEEPIGAQSARDARIVSMAAVTRRMAGAIALETIGAAQGVQNAPKDSLASSVRRFHSLQRSSQRLEGTLEAPRSQCSVSISSSHRWAPTSADLETCWSLQIP